MNPSEVATLTILTALVVGIYALGMWRAWELLGTHRLNMLGRFSLLRETEDQATQHTAGEQRHLAPVESGRSLDERRSGSYEQAP
jgi:hypothetical protein